MFNLFEIIQAAQGGHAMDNLARQYGLTPDQVQRAVEALLPAFSLGLQRNVQDPASFLGTLGLMGSGRYADPFESARSAFSADAVQQGNDVLARLFGSKEVSRRIAAQAAVMSGIGQNILKQMLPVIAAMLMGGLFKSAADQGLGGVLGQLGGLFGGAGAQAAQPGREQAAGQGGAATTPADIFGQLSEMIQRGAMAGFPGGFGVPQPPAPPQSPPRESAGAPPHPFEALLGGLLGGMFGTGAAKEAAQPEPALQPEPPPEAPRAQAQGFDPAQFGLDPLTQMFETGRAVQDQNLAAMQAIFDEVLGPAPGRRRK
ncbi:DUF937 domain-containing protein [Chelatococcus sp. SYSU_G07232]|uniref:DUF937 domain-containing protein n=1 Tax=Chelatococcus albus TaxID=3047466 RepID=A0ABT7AKV4_9HYPH|nr:DUF937 domain-containing protein [Chelatococcus sp. SYSU_G07232]MDJ1160004.1 DUF937 domain-containing protein [Chelatococcus sp. SYSU_G07232]